MPINRAPFNALVDDDGSGLTGTVWNKAQIKAVLLDPIDALPVAGQTYISSTATGAIVSFNPGTLGLDTLIDWRGAANLTIEGLVGGVQGMRVTIINRSGSLGLVSVAYQSATATAGQKFFNHASSAPTIIGLLGSVTWVYEGSAWSIVSHVQGTWTNGLPHTSSAQGGGTFTGVTGYSRWALIGRSMNWSFDLTGTIAGTVTQAGVSIPGGYSFATLGGGVGYGMALYAQGAKAVGIQYVASAREARFYADALGAASFTAGAARFIGTVNFEVA